jgi:hypothetical protein
MQRIQGRTLFTGLLAAFLVPLGLGYAHSWGLHKSSSSDRITTVTLADNMKLQDGTTLPAGTYQMQVPDGSPSPRVEFLKDGKAVASADAKLVNESKKNAYTEVDSVNKNGSQFITTIRPGGWHEVLRFSQSNQGGS